MFTQWEPVSRDAVTYKGAVPGLSARSGGDAVPRLDRVRCSARQPGQRSAGSRCASGHLVHARSVGRCAAQPGRLPAPCRRCTQDLCDRVEPHLGQGGGTVFRRRSSLRWRGRWRVAGGFHEPPPAGRRFCADQAAVLDWVAPLVADLLDSARGRACGACAGLDASPAEMHEAGGMRLNARLGAVGTTLDLLEPVLHIEPMQFQGEDSLRRPGGRICRQGRVHRATDPRCTNPVVCRPRGAWLCRGAAAACRFRSWRWPAAPTRPRRQRGLVTCRWRMRWEDPGATRGGMDGTASILQPQAIGRSTRALVPQWGAAILVHAERARGVATRWLRVLGAHWNGTGCPRPRRWREALADRRGRPARHRPAPPVTLQLQVTLQPQVASVATAR